MAQRLKGYAPRKASIQSQTASIECRPCKSVKFGYILRTSFAAVTMISNIDSRFKSGPFWLAAGAFFAVALSWPLPSVAQSTATSGAIMGGTNPTGEKSNIKDNDVFSNTVPVHKNPSNVICLSATALSRQQIINPNIYENIVLFKNVCSQPIKVSLCYFGKSNCLTPSISAYRRQEFLLGLSTGTKDFRFQYRELFN